ncbi:MAG TPA: hypothetical protein VNT51_01920 [Miltoncostaeaceae bacterium]|jgi:hypothetical protein|nr:hypothetical protein [Miltoncostaeaceae bacterium]
MADWKDDDDFPEPIRDPEQLARAQAAYRSTFDLRRRVLRYAYVVLGLLVLLVVILALTR